MKIHLIILVSTILLVSTTQSTLANFVVPLPLGKQQINRDTLGHDEYIKGDDLSLDLQAAEAPANIDPLLEESRCYTYGEPILAAQSGVVSKVVHLSVRHKKNGAYGAHVTIKHDDNSTGYYAHMINDSNKIYVKKGDRIEQGQIIGLMGDTGNIISKYKNNPCPHDKNYGTHLHFELRNSTKTPQSLDGEKPLTKGSIINSKTRPIDKDALYANHHFGKYPYIPQIEQVHSISPLVAKPGSRTQFLLKGKYFTEDSNFSLPFCESQQPSIINQQLIEIDCKTKLIEDRFELSFPNLYQPNGELLVNFVLTNTPNNINIDDVTFIPPHPGEILELTITGSGLSTDLDLKVQSKTYKTKNGKCDFKDQFATLSPTKIIARCQLPLNIGPVKQDNNQALEIDISSNNRTLYEDQFEINYGISSPRLSPLQATYDIPTRFSITGKNVHRSSIFFIENCEQKSFRIIEQLYNKVIFECLITPKNDGTSSHQFFFKTRSRFNSKGIDELSDEEDRANIILSGYLTVIHDTETRVESISPHEAIIGQETLFTVTGNRLPYSSTNIPLVWMEDCQGNGRNGAVEIIPESYTHNRFQFRCTPQFTPGEQNAYLILENQYNTDNRQVKESLWKEFDQFFEDLSPKKLHIKSQKSTGNELLSEHSVKFVSSLYEFIKAEEQFQFQFFREDGLYQISGDAEIQEIQLGNINQSHRQQEIHISGLNLPYDLVIQSDDCAQVAITYGSSERFEAVCLLEKVSLQELHILDAKKEKHLKSFQTDLVEVYEVHAHWTRKETLQVDIRGVNLLNNISITSPDCQTLKNILDPSSSQRLMSCQIKSRQFSKPESLKLNVETKDGVVLWDKSVEIQNRPITSIFKPLASKTSNSQFPTTHYSLQTTHSSASSKRFALYPDISSPVLREAVTQLTRQNLIEGFPDNSFRSDENYNNQTRAEFTANLVQQLPYYLEPTDLTETLKQYIDLNPESPHLSEISFAMMNNIIPKNSHFSPDDPISRGEAALIMHKSQQLLNIPIPSPEKEREELVRAEG